MVLLVLNIFCNFSFIKNSSSTLNSELLLLCAIFIITDKCKYYLTEEQNRRVNIIDVTKEIEKIYEKLARPLQELENLVNKIIIFIIICI